MTVAAGPAVLVVSASMGAGHDAVARELGRRLTARGARVSHRDWLALGGRGGPALRGFYAGMLRHAPRGYDAAMTAWTHAPGFFEAVTRAGGRAAEDALAAAARGSDLVVATYNLAGQALGRLRLAGRVRAPAVTVITDAGPHPYWWHPGTDLHVLPTGLARVAGPFASAVADPVVRPELVGIGGNGDRVVVTGGSWGAGGVEGVATVLAGQRPLVLCGNDHRLRERLRRIPGVDALGWVPDIAAVLRRASVLVDPAAGTSTWEALTAGVPVIAPPRLLPGHGRRNVEALAGAGLVTRVRTDAELRAAAGAPVPVPFTRTGADAADLLLAALAASGR